MRQEALTVALVSSSIVHISLVWWWWSSRRRLHETNEATNAPGNDKAADEAANEATNAPGNNKAADEAANEATNDHAFWWFLDFPFSDAERRNAKHLRIFQWPPD